MKKLIKPLWLALATLSALLTVVSCVKDLKPQEQEVNFDLLLTSDQSQINQDQQSVANQITITEEKVDCPRPTKYSVSFTYDETVGSLLFLGEPVQSGKPFALSSLSNLTLTYQAKKLADNKVNIVVANDAPKKLSKELVWSILADEFYRVTVEHEGEGSVTVTGADNLSAVQPDTKLSVTAEPAEGWKLTSLTANDVDILNDKSFVVTANTTVRAVFTTEAPETYAVTLEKEGEGKVDITGADDLSAVVTGAKLTVSAEPASGWRLVSMTANGEDILSSKSFVVKDNTTVKVVFKKQPPKTYAVTLVKEGEGKVDITGATDLGAVVTGTKLTVSAEPASGWKLVSMTANGVDILSSKSFVVTENTTVEVVFEMTSKNLRIHLVRTDLVSQYLKSPKLAKYVFQSDLDLVQKYFPKVVTDKGEELTPYMIKRGKRLNGTTDDVVEWTLHYGSIPIGTKVSFVLDEAAMSPLVATLSKGDYIGGKNYANQSFVIEKTLWETDEFTLYYSLAEGFAYFAYPSQTQTSSEHGYINVKPPYRPFRVLARYGGESTDIPPYEIVAVPTQSQVEITPIGLAGWAYNGLRLTELDAKQAPVDTDYPANVLSIPIKNKSSIVTCRWYYKGQ